MRKLFFFFLFSLVVFTAYTQISLSFPMERMVFQRSNNNTGLIRIAGNFTVEYDSIMARVEVRADPGSYGVNTPWIKIAERTDKPYFKGNFQAVGGWYTLYVEAYKGGNVVGSQNVQRVGVGEVFVVAGQSNASGTNAGYGHDATSQLANVMNFSSRDNNYNALPIGFSHMSDPPSGFTSIGPSQCAMWNWGDFATSMIQEFHVPILIYGAAYAGTEIKWWYESAYGQALTNPPPNRYPVDPNPAKNQPYGGLKSVLQYYASLTGLRGVLWHQGETDGFNGTDSLLYKSQLQAVIAKSRADIGVPDLAWMVARASVVYDIPRSNVRWAQNQLINEDVNIYEGPDTDLFLGPGYRTDGTHLNTDLGLSTHGQVWKNAVVNTGFLVQSAPVIAEDFIDLNISCISNSQVQLSSSDSFLKFAWSAADNSDSLATGYTRDDLDTNIVMLPPAGYYRKNWQFDSTSSITVPVGNYALNAIKSSGKRVFSPFVNLASIQIPPAPTISGPTQILQDQSATLTGSNCSGSYLWSTGSRLSEITVSPPPGNVSYSLSCKGLYCYSSSTSHQLEVSDCYGQSLGVIGTAPSPTALYRTQMTLTSSQKVNSGTDATYNSGKAIVINPGFTANSGSIFKAEIKNCP